MTDDAKAYPSSQGRRLPEGGFFEQSPVERGAFPLQARRELRDAFAYLQARERADYYQAIARVFLKHARRYYRIYLTLDELAVELISLYSDYSDEKCRSDLDQLATWGNVVRSFDTTQRHTTIESFRHPTVLYRATPETLEIEETFLRLEARTETAGELRQGDLAHLVELFEEVDALIREVDGDDPAEAYAGARRDLAAARRPGSDDPRQYLEVHPHPCRRPSGGLLSSA